MPAWNWLDFLFVLYTLSLISIVSLNLYVSLRLLVKRSAATLGNLSTDALEGSVVLYRKITSRTCSSLRSALMHATDPIVTCSCVIDYGENLIELQGLLHVKGYRLMQHITSNPAHVMRCVQVCSQGITPFQGVRSLHPLINPASPPR